MKLEYKGVDELAEKIRNMSNKSTGIIKRAVYEGARVLIEEVKAQISALPEVEDRRVPAGKLPLTGVTSAQKRGLLEGVGTAHMQNNNGFINTKVGFEGYNSTRTKKYPNGQPNALIARSVNSGSSAHTKIPFMGRAATAARAKAEAAMAARLDEDTKKLMN